MNLTTLGGRKEGRNDPHLSSLRSFFPPLSRRYRVGGLLHRPLPLALHTLPRNFHVDPRESLEEDTAAYLLLKEFHHLQRGKQRGDKVGHQIIYSVSYQSFVTPQNTGKRKPCLPIEQHNHARDTDMQTLNYRYLLQQHGEGGAVGFTCRVNSLKLYFNHAELITLRRRSLRDLFSLPLS